MALRIISDLHGYRIPAKMAFDELAKFKGSDSFEAYVCIGDIASGGNQEDAVVDLLQNYAVLTVKGNHCKNDTAKLSDKVKDYLSKCKTCLQYDSLYGKKAIFIHDNPLSIISPYSPKMGTPPWETDSGIHTDVQAMEVFGKTDYDLIFIGHTHQPEHWELTRDGVLNYEYMYSGRLNPDSRYIINPGAVASPKVLSPHAVAHPEPDFTSTYSVFDGEEYALHRFQTELFKEGKPVFDVPDGEKSVYR
jgi:predicted phosphodiesterase